METQNQDRISLEDAQSVLSKYILVPQASERVDLLDSLGRVLAKTVVASVSQPPFPRSPLDGYALYHEDSRGASQDKPVILRVVSKILAGESGDVSLQRGEAVRIMTGAPIPPACTAVIRQEDTDYGQVNVQINRPVTAYQNYCHAGEDYKEGQILVEKGSRLFPEHLGIIASTGKHEVEVRKKLTVGLLSTGAELTEPGESLVQGQIYNSGHFLIGARIKELGCKLVRLKAFGDDARRTAQEIDQAFDSCDLIVTTGGVSVGEKDIMHPVNEILATEKLFWGVDLKPGTPALASLHKGKLLLGLSGNPNAAGITLELLFGQVYSKAWGRPFETKRVKFYGDYTKKSTTRRFIKAIYRDNEVRLAKGLITSGNLSASAGANCLIDVPPGSSGIADGDWVRIIIYRRT